MKKLMLLLTLIVGLFAACSRAGGPEQIAAYPQGTSIARYARSSEQTLVYNATLDLEVWNVERATERAKEIAFEQDGYLVSAQSWYRDGEKHTNIVLAIPSYQFDRARDDLLRLGHLTGEWISSDLVSHGDAAQDIYAQITIYLQPQELVIPEISLPKWRQVRTFERAWSVFVSIFSFLLDVIIWVLVVAGPFALIGWVAVKGYQWQRKVADNHKQETKS